jgi:hypothetical protein
MKAATLMKDYHRGGVNPIGHCAAQSTSSIGVTRMVDFRKGWRGRLWQGRFASLVLT